MDFYSRMRDTANKLLKGKGQTVILTRSTVGTYDATKGSSSITTTTQTGWGAVFEYGNNKIDGVIINVGDKQLLLSALNAAGNLLTAPMLNDTVTIGGTVYTISMIKNIAPAGTTVLFDCNIRGIT